MRTSSDEIDGEGDDNNSTNNRSGDKSRGKSGR